MQFLHGRIGFAIDELAQHRECVIDIAFDRSLDVRRTPFEYVVRDLVFLAGVPDTETQAQELGTAVPDDVPESIVAAMATASGWIPSVKGPSRGCAGRMQILSWPGTWPA